MREKKPRCKIWIEFNGHVVFGTGRLELFQAIEEYGSINKAAAKLGMSYRAAWGKIHATEQFLGVELIDKHVGGTQSGSELSETAKKLMRAFIEFKEESIRAVDQLYEKHFKDILLQNKNI